MTCKVPSAHSLPASAYHATAVAGACMVQHFWSTSDFLWQGHRDVVECETASTTVWALYAALHWSSNHMLYGAVVPSLTVVSCFIGLLMQHGYTVRTGAIWPYRMCLEDQCKAAYGALTVVPSVHLQPPVCVPTTEVIGLLSDEAS